MQRIGPYELVGELGRGGAGVIYRARDPGLQRDVALKLLSTQRSSSPASLARFRQEAEALARLTHPHVVRVHTAGEHEGTPYLVMDLVEGASLANRILESGPLPVEEALQIALDLAHALEHVHAHALLHRDLKPDNVLLTSDGVPLLTDFGLAKDRSSDQALSREGAVMGTPGYWPPEQATGQLSKVGPAADVYGLGATLYAMLTGLPPVQGETVRQLLVATCETVPERPSKSRPEIPAAVDALCARCLAKAPRDRFPDAASLAGALERALAGEPVRARPRGRVLALLGLVLVGLGAWFARGGPVSADSQSAEGPRPTQTVTEAIAPDQVLERWLAGLEAREQIDVESAAGAISILAPLPEASLERLRAIPKGPERDYLLALALLLDRRTAEAVDVVGAGSSPLQRAVQLCRDSEECSTTLDGTALLAGGAAAGRELMDQLTPLLEEATRVVKSEPGALGKLSARRFQATLGYAVTQLRTLQTTAYQHVGPRVLESAIAVAEESVEARQLVVVGAWVVKDLKKERPHQQRSACERLIALEPTPDWDPVYVFLRGYMLTETASWPDIPLQVSIEAGEAGIVAAEDQAWVYERFVHQLESLQKNLARAYLHRGGLEFVRSRGEGGLADIQRSHVLAMRALVDPLRPSLVIPPVGQVDATWLRRLERTARSPRLSAAVAFLVVGRYELVEVMAELLTEDFGEDLADLLRAEVELIVGDVAAAHARLSALTQRPIAENYRDFWGALAHARHLGGDVNGAAQAIKAGRRCVSNLWIPWHDPDRVSEVLAGEAWWPGVESATDGE